MRSVLTPVSISTDELQRLERGRFVELLGGVFEHSPWVAERAFAAGPFHSVGALHGAMVEVMRRASRRRQLALIRVPIPISPGALRSGAS